MVRLDVYWAAIAPKTRPSGFLASDPNSPGYDWTTFDKRVRELAAAHFQILITIWSAPSWAEGSPIPKSAIPGTWKPSASAFGAFAHAIATRYDGHYDPLGSDKTLPRVRFWQGWNEPNLSEYLAPQWNKVSANGYAPASPGIYRSLQNAFYAAVKGVSAQNYVLAAGTAPYGDDPGNLRMRPVEFDRSLFCINRSLKRTCRDTTHLDAIDNHPYGIGGPNWRAYNPDDVAVPDVYKLTRVLHAAERAGTVLPKGKKGVWVTEIAWDTKPPDPQGVPTKLEARWLEQALYELWRQGVSTVLWWQLVDAPPIPNYALTYQAGVYLLGGKPKPSATAFRFPFLGTRQTKHNVVFWGRAPVAGTLQIQQHVGRRWQTRVRAHVRARQVFELPVSIHGEAKLRASIGISTSLTWSVKR